MLEFMLVLIAVVAAMVAIIVNRKSLLACVVIALVAVLSCSAFLVLYENTHSFESYSSLLTVTLICSAVLIAIILAVTLIGVNMYFKKKTSKSPALKAGSTPGTILISAEGRPSPSGIFGKQPEKRTLAEEQAASHSFWDKEDALLKARDTVVRKETPSAPIKSAPIGIAPIPMRPLVKPTQSVAEATLLRMLEKANMYKAAKQYTLAEQMYRTYILRSVAQSEKRRGELLLLSSQIESGNREMADKQMNELLGKLRAKEYEFTPAEKQILANLRMKIRAMSPVV